MRQYMDIKTLALAALLAGFCAPAWSQGAADPADTTTRDAATQDQPGTGMTGSGSGTMADPDAGTTGTTRDTTMGDDDAMLPATASPMWLLGLLSGTGLLGLAAGLRAVRGMRRV